MFVVVAEFMMKADKVEAFKTRVAGHTANSRKEKGCLTFTVHQDPDEPRHFFIYEVYRERAAFDFHVAQDYLQQFRKDSAEMYETRTVKFWNPLP
jgi:quinol monooxygenase YgiN